jgi:myo-inositol-1(or 4)-monophosphatase
VDRLGKRRVFIVDPIDGTRAFIRGEDSWTVSLAVVEDCIAIAGIVYAPARDEMWAAALGAGVTLNGAPVRHPPSRKRRVPLIPAAGAVHKELQAAGLQYQRGPLYPSVAYRLVQVASGALDAAVARRGAQDWDIAAAAVILGEAGIEFRDVCNGAVRFNRKETRHGALAALSEASLQPLLHAALIRVYGCPEPQRSTAGVKAT